MQRFLRRHLPVLALSVVGAAPLLAHAGHDEASLLAGLGHPVHGLDHLLAMVAVGLMGVRCAQGPAGQRHALWAVPASFLAAMAAGGLLALGGLPLPGAEWGIALSVLIFGAFIALAAKPSTALACGVAAAFAILHGHAHVAEMAGSSVGAYMGGFLASTAILHAAGLAVGVAVARAWHPRAVRVAGAGVAAASLLLFANLLGA